MSRGSFGKSAHMRCLPLKRRGLDKKPRVNFASYASRSALLRTVDTMMTRRSYPVMRELDC